MADLKISQLTSATTPLVGTEVLPIVQSSSTKKVATDDLTVKNVRSNVTTGILQIAGPAAAATRTMTVPDANFTAARTDAAQTFSGVQTMSGSAVIGGDSNSTAGVTVRGTNANNGIFRLGQTGKSYTILGGDYQGVMELFTESGAGDILFTVSGTTRGRMNSSGFKPIAGNGVDFSANTPAAGKTSTLLNWYEEGTWTPTLAYGFTVNSGSFAATCRYTRIGRLVTLQLYQTSGNITWVNNAYISGLPFAVAAPPSGVGQYTNNGPSISGTVYAAAGDVIYLLGAQTAQTSLVFTVTYTT